MEDVKININKMIDLISNDERRTNRDVDRLIYKIECLLVWLSDTNRSDTKVAILPTEKMNGK